MGKFELEIALGNAAMQTSADVARALERIASRLRNIADDEGASIRDENGNKVGTWSATWPETES